MIRKILVSSDGSEPSQRAVDQAIEIAKATGASLVGCMVTEPYPLSLYGDLMLGGIETLQHFEEEERELSQRLLAPIARAAQVAGLRFASRSVAKRSAAEAIVETAEQEGCDLICMAPQQQHRFLKGHLDGETTKVLTRAKVPVLLCH